MQPVLQQACRVWRLHRRSTQLGEGDAVWIDPKTGNVQKSNTKVSAAKHQAVMAGGGKEIPRGAVIYK